VSRICVVIQSEAFRSSAGVRIRYDRFIDGCFGTDTQILVRPLAEIVAAPLDCDAYIFCKTFSSVAIAFAQRIKAHGRIVAQDLFDDYFSQCDDERLFQYRNWMRQIEPFTDVALCTTPRMAEVIAEFLPHSPIIVIEDPIDDFNPIRIAALVDRKIERARRTRHLKLAWFGIGDNPLFPVGIADLTSPAMLSQIAAFKTQGWDTSLTVATNQRALSADGLADLRRCPLPVELVEWSEAVERDVLAAADVALLPVGTQGFSRAKSMNRAVTALNQGCQILSIGEPLYAGLAPFIYRTAEDVLLDLEAGSALLTGSSVPALTSILAKRANAFDAGATFAEAVLTACPRPCPPLLAVVHGWQSEIATHKLACGPGAVSVRSPFCQAAWNFGVRFDLDGDRIVGRVSAAIADRLQLPILIADSLTIRDIPFFAIDPKAYPPLPRIGAELRAPLANLAGYQRVMTAIFGAIRSLIPGAQLCTSDTSRWNVAPIWADHA
jgi:hypothetical protein